LRTIQVVIQQQFFDLMVRPCWAAMAPRTYPEERVMSLTGAISAVPCPSTTL
jgi:hypothetical protein